MRVTPILAALSLGLAVGAGPALADGVTASGHCGGHNADAGVTSNEGTVLVNLFADDGGISTVVDGLETLVTGEPGSCGGPGSGHAGASAELGPHEAGACFNGGSVSTDHDETGCSGQTLATLP